MNRVAWAVVAAVAMVGCGGPVSVGPTGPGGPSGSGTVTVEYLFDGVEAPTSVNVRLIDGAVANQACATLDPDVGVLTEYASLPVTGEVEFANVPAGSRWIAFAIGYDLNQQPVAAACQDVIEVGGSEPADIFLTLRNVPLQLVGPYSAELDTGFISFDPTIVSLFLVACYQVSEIPDLACDISADVIDLLSALEVSTEWTFVPVGSTFQADIVWTGVEGVAAPTSPPLGTGSMLVEVVGARQAQFKNLEMDVEIGKFTVFVAEEVYGYDLPVEAEILIPLIDEFFDLVVTGTDGGGTLVDFDGEYVADEVEGSVDAEALGSGFDFNFRAIRN